ncbi:MAG: ABC transporter substrate-binding protein [Anaerolineae bacterium]|nr:ABC transporter substrate-binding protein [Anaerolineae bacterium]MCX8068108.1 ABC transporter substrate-binding protein [Anaerolineae bacterium]MDW7991716.1 ABC transporter substrate-binding protein [Anaerolineae bacterium]
MRRALILAIALVLAAALTAGCTPRPSGRIVYGLTLAPSGIDPHIHASSELGIPLTSVYDTLIYKDPMTGDYVPGLAEKWEVSADGLVYTFYLKKGVKFHDGTPFNAEAVRFNFERITNPDIASQKARFMLGPYDRTEVVDEYTVRIVLKEPFAPLMDSLSQVYLAMASPTAVQKWGKEYQLHQVGTGPFVFVEYEPGARLLLRRNPDYAWGPPVYRNKTARLEEIEFRFFTDPATRSPALESGEADVMGEIPPQDAVRLKESKDFRIEAVAIPGASLMFFLNSARPPLDDLKVRQALLYGTDRRAIVSTIFRDTSPVACGPLSAVTFGYDPSVCSFYSYEPERAKMLLEEAGWKDTDGDGVREKGGQPLALDVYLMGWGYVPQIGELLADQWSRLGVRANLQMVSYSEALKIAQENGHHVMPFALFSSDPDILRRFFFSGSNFNWSKVNDPEMDGWLKEAARVSDRTQRAKLYSQVQQRVMESALVIPIRDYVNLNGVNNRVQGLRYDAQGWFPWLIDVSVK